MLEDWICCCDKGIETADVILGETCTFTGRIIGEA